MPDQRWMWMKKRDIRHIEIFSTWDSSSTETVALRVPRWAYNITVTIFPKQQKQLDFVLCKLPHTAHVWSATHPAILFLSLFHSHHCPLTKSSFWYEIKDLLQDSFWRHQMMKRLWDRSCPEKSRLSSKNIYWRIANFYEVVFSYMVLKVCFSARHTQLSWKNVDAVHPALYPLSLSYFWTKHLAELCQEIMQALPSEIMPSEGCKWPWISGNSLLVPQQSMVQSPLQNCFVGKKSMLKMHRSLLWCSAGVCRKMCF